MDPIRIQDAGQLGALIRRTRKAIGLRQDQLAGVSNVGVRFLVEVERGKPTAQIGKVLQVLSILGCSLSVTPPAGLDVQAHLDGGEG